jgi:hypothetical protein
MKKISVLLVLLIAGISHYGFSQDTQLLPSYFAIKDALVADNPTVAGAKAAEFVKQVSVGDSKLSQKDRDVLFRNATAISENKDIKRQREQFSDLSNSLISIAKASKLNTEPVYVQYCPMKKSSWLSSEKAIKNPYYGKSMLTCGNVSQTLN